MNKIQQDLDEVLETFVQDRIEKYEALWVDYEPEIKILSETFDLSRIKPEKLIDKINSLPEISSLKERIDNMTISNDALIEECDYLRNQLRKEDRDFYEALDLNKLRNEG